MCFILTKIAERMVFSPVPLRRDWGSLLRRNKMAKRPKKNQKSPAKLQDYVVVASVEDVEQAKEYETLLKINDIPAMVKEQNEPSIDVKRAVVMVPEDFLDEAHVVIESQEAYDDFYDLQVDDEDDVDFNGELFGDEF